MTRLIIAAVGLALVVGMALGSVIGNPFGASAQPSVPNPGHSWSEIGDLPGTIWHSNNDGPGSGLDADTLDGVQASDLRGVRVPIGGGIPVTAADTERATNSLASIPQKWMYVRTPGNYTVMFDLRTNASGGTACGLIFRGETPLGLEHCTDSTTYVTFSETGDFPADMQVVLNVRRGSAWSQPAYFRNFRLSVREVLNEVVQD